MIIKKLSKLIVLLMICSLLFALMISCSDTPDEPDTPEEPGDENVPPYLDLTKNGQVLFTIVYNAKESDVRAQVQRLLDAFEDKGLKVTAVTADKAGENTGCEILVGASLENRSEYIYDTTEVGHKGFTYFIKDNKVIIAGGSAESTANGLKTFASDVLQLDSDSTDVNNISLDRTLSYIKKTTYRISGVTINGNPLTEYTILNTDNSYITDSIKYFQKSVYNYTGINLSYSDTEDGKNIIFRIVDNAGKDGYKVYVKDNNLYVDCAYFNSFRKGTESFVSAKFVRANGEVKFGKDFEYTTEVSKVYYEDYGAKGDGTTDDFNAIRDAHNFANIAGHTVVATDGATYNMGVHTETINVKTNVIWSGARFIIDDSTIESNSTASKTNIFTFARSKDSLSINSLGALTKGQKNIGVTFDAPMMIYLCDVTNTDRKVYIRYGANSNNGSDRQEVILVDKDGNVDPSTPIIWDYPEGVRATAYYIDDPHITIKGGTFTTICNLSESKSRYYERGLKVMRSNTTLTGIKHYISGEPDPKVDPSAACPYTGFYSANYAHNVLFENCLLTGHTMYKTTQSDGDYVSQGSYDTQVTRSNLVTWRNCTQTNDINNTRYWGAMASNFCKNLTYDGCKLSRFDAHQGMHNTTIINSELGHQKINAIGSGLLHIENCIVNGNNVVVLRTDYGSTWEGDVVIKDVTLNNTGGATVFGGAWYNHNFGYQCYLPKNVVIDNLVLAKDSVIYVFPSMASGDFLASEYEGAPNINVIVMPETITLKNNKGNYTYRVSSNTTAFGYLEITKG